MSMQMLSRVRLGRPWTRPQWLRRFALFQALVFGLFALAMPVQVLADTLAKPNPTTAVVRPKTWRVPVKLYPAASAHCVAPLPAGTHPASAITHGILPLSSLTLLDEVGRLAHGVLPAEVASWKSQLHHLHLPAQEAAKLYIWLGEYALAHDQNPDLAQWHFRQAQHRTKPADRLYGLAAYDAIVAICYQGAYQQAADGFNHLLISTPRLSGFDRRSCALWARHAGACAGIHQKMPAWVSLSQLD